MTTGASLTECVAAFSKASICCIGDLILDRYLHGRVDRVSPEAPVPILSLESERMVLGGAGNVAANLTALGCQVSMCGVVGNDAEDDLLLDLLYDHNIVTSLVRCDSYCLPVKTRLVAGNNQLLRVDREKTASVLCTDTEELCKRQWLDVMMVSDLILLSDYAKGGLTNGLIQWVIRWARQHNKMVLVDPKGSDYLKYQGATILKPNLKEFNMAVSGRLCASEEGFEEKLLVAARELMSRLALDGILVTLSEHGMAYLSADDPARLIRCTTEAKSVFDVSGAGDTVLAVLGACLAVNADMKTAMRLANLASSIVVEKLGTATVNQTELLAKVKELTVGDSGTVDAFCTDMLIARLRDDKGVMMSRDKLVSRERLLVVVAKLRREHPNIKIGFTNGCFDCLHPGHLDSLEKSRSECDCLIVAVNSDASVRKLKGNRRPLQDQVTRSTILAGLTCVDWVVLFEEDNALGLVEELRPDVIAKQGYHVADNWPEADYVASYGGKVVELAKLDGYSTTQWLEKLLKKAAIC